MIVGVQQGLSRIVGSVPKTLQHGFFRLSPCKVNLAKVVIADDEFTGFPTVGPPNVVQEGSYQLFSGFC